MRERVPMMITVLAFGVVCIMNAAATTDAQDAKEKPTEFNSVLAALIQQGMDHIAHYDQFKKALHVLQEEHKSSGGKLSKKKKREPAKAVQPKDDWSGAVNDLVDTVDAFFGDNKNPSERRRAKGADQVDDIFAEYNRFKADLKNSKVDYQRLLRIASRTLEAMTSRPKLKNSIAEGISELLSLPPSVKVDEWLEIASQTITMWNTPLGQKLFKPAIDNMVNNFKKSDFDVYSVKPSLDMLLVSMLGPEMQKQVQPMVDVGFRVVDQVVKLLKKSGLTSMMQYADPSKTLRAAKDVYVEVMLDTIGPLQEVVQSTDEVIDELHNVLDVTRRYRNVPGTMDVRFQRGNANDPVAKVKALVTQIDQTKEVIEESREAVVGFHAYPLHHPNQAIDAVKQLFRKLKAARQALGDFWPLRGFLKAHPIVKGHREVQQHVAELQVKTKRAMDKTHKVQTLIKDIQNLEGMFDLKKIYEDVIDILRGHPKLGFLLVFLDMFRGEFDKLKEIAYIN